MKRRIVIPALAALAAVSALSGLGTTASAAEGLLPNTVTDPSGDVTGKSIDITKVAVASHADSAYKAVVTFEDLKLTRSTRRVLDLSAVLPIRQSEQALLASSTSVDFRTNPSGRVSVKLWTTPPLGTPAVTACAGLKAAANYRLNKLYLTIPDACWPGGGLVSVSARAWKAPTGTWDGTSLAIPEGAPNDSTSSFLYTEPPAP